MPESGSKKHKAPPATALIIASTAVDVSSVSWHEGGTQHAATDIYSSTLINYYIDILKTDLRACAWMHLVFHSEEVDVGVTYELSWVVHITVRKHIGATSLHRATLAVAHVCQRTDRFIVHATCEAHIAALAPLLGKVLRNRSAVAAVVGTDIAGDAVMALMWRTLQTYVPKHTHLAARGEARHVAARHAAAACIQRYRRA